VIGASRRPAGPSASLAGDPWGLAVLGLVRSARFAPRNSISIDGSHPPLAPDTRVGAQVRLQVQA
jgi:hypothetical protein